MSVKHQETAMIDRIKIAKLGPVLAKEFSRAEDAGKLGQILFNHSVAQSVAGTMHPAEHSRRPLAVFLLEGADAGTEMAGRTIASHLGISFAHVSGERNGALLSA